MAAPLHDAPRPWHESARLRATYLPGRGRRLVVSFAGIGKPDAHRQSEEFVASSHQDGRNHVLFVADTLRSWYNDPGIREEIVALVDAYRRRHAIEDTVTFGNSMGGYGAVLLAGALGARVCLALSAQYSADPAVVPEEQRWREYRDRIARFTCPPLEAALSPECLYFVLHGGGRVERPHWSRFPSRPNLHHYLVGHAGHGVGRRLKAAGLMTLIAHHAINARPVAFRRALAAAVEIRRAPRTPRTPRARGSTPEPTPEPTPGPTPGPMPRPRPRPRPAQTPGLTPGQTPAAAPSPRG
ncbi:MAG: hypothetical protein Kow0058_04380 [Roseovarius sp.]